MKSQGESILGWHFDESVPEARIYKISKDPK
jgi:hypothetical protein